jgi:predicted anti-sigma-YlaC factor YlaD
MTHLTPDEIIDAVEETLAPARLSHLTTCDECRTETDAVAAILREAHSVNAFEPSPLFWDHFSERVRASVAAEADRRARSRRWFEWPVLAPFGALAVLIVVLVSSLPTSVGPVPPTSFGDQAGSTEPADAAANDERWAMMFDLVGDIDLDSVVDAGLLGRPGTAEQVLVHLTRTEQAELVRLLRQELRSGG